MMLLHIVFIGGTAGSLMGSVWLFTSAKNPIQKHGVQDHGLRSKRLNSWFQEILSMAGVLKIVREVTKRKRIAHQRNAIIKEMPRMLDVLTLGLSSGLSFDSSLDLYCNRCSGVLSEKMNQALLSWQMGATTRSTALEEIAVEYGITSLLSFASVVTESLAFGTPLSDSLERQAGTIRDDQRAALEAEIEKVPVKMLLPLGTLIVPAMLIAILGPLLGPALSVW